MTWVTPEPNWWPLIGLAVFLAVGALVVEYWPEPRTPEQREVDALARDAKRREKAMQRRGWAR